MFTPPEGNPYAVAHAASIREVDLLYGVRRAGKNKLKYEPFNTHTVAASTRLHPL
ncbi:MAG: hypothetical protein H0W76_11860 [Pyrinomonadaceae bacterium]|nr:hypothetical protein [Pyrinomonadaceae bacterium]